ncbi:hypothetical protein [Xylanimonas protaetiae]|uniref:Uncharacterized protein n=1 Tax=Xylanimonas protaetiae TaxID=2509457 RepID=A0A4P6FLW7_9MICO|nr:hypothetical protein [Xylanimonas protaetiae]QAY71638.1 hypothetical protein ET471_17680 [Xylanimonas protaetiae]
MATMLVEQMRAADAPPSQFECLGLPAEGQVTAEHLLTEPQRHLVEASMHPFPRLADVTSRFPDLVRPLGELLDDPKARDVVLEYLPWLRNETFAHRSAGTSIYPLAAATLGITADMVEALGTALTPTPARPDGSHHD